VRTFGTVFALVGIGLCFLLFALLSVGYASELLDRGMDLERAGAAIITLGAAVTCGWIVVVALVKRGDFSWGADAFRACTVFAYAGAIGCLALAFSIALQYWGDLGHIVYFDSSAKFDLGWYWPAWMSVTAWVFVALLLAWLGRLFWRWVGRRSP